MRLAIATIESTDLEKFKFEVLNHCLELIMGSEEKKIINFPEDRKIAARFVNFKAQTGFLDEADMAKVYEPLKSIGDI